MESCEMTQILVIFTTPGTSGGVFTGLCFEILRLHAYRAQNWCLSSLGMTRILFMFTIKEDWLWRFFCVNQLKC